MLERVLLQRRVKEAWSKLPKNVQDQLTPQILAAHQYLLSVRNKNVSPSTPAPPHQLMPIYSLLHDDPDRLFESFAAPEGILTWVAPNGGILFGGVEYDATDIGWGYLLIALVATWGQTPSFNTQPKTIQVPDTATLFIVGDWGGWNQPAKAIAAAAKRVNPDYFIHLGDVYYAGTNRSDILDPYETTHFLEDWPGPAGKSFALNSNHDMYAHATGFFKTTLASNVFAPQAGCSYFALYNKNFRIVGLDTAYYCHDVLYMHGNLGDAAQPQTMFLADQAQQAASTGQNLIVLTHHNGLQIDGTSGKTLWNQVTKAISPSLKNKKVCWYWGHEHVAAVYKPQTTADVTIYPRCCGHGCMPWGVASELQSPNVAWGEKKVLGPGKNYFVTNGFATLALNGASAVETFYDQNGNSDWTGSWLAIDRAQAAGRP